MTNFRNEREQMTADLQQRGIRHPAVLAAMHRVPREQFIAPSHHHLAYSDAPLPIAAGQTISQPYIVAYMLQALHLSPQDRVLEIGTGSGYAAAILSLIAAEVYTVERHQELAQSAANLLAKLRFHNIRVHWGDGSLGWPEFAPYNGIIVAAGGPSIPPALRQQLAIGGRLVMPVGRWPHAQRLIRLTRRSTHEFTREKMGSVRFVPLIGAQGWRDEEHGTPT
jgi:protein-L-isoaspartate(D-aspartate) O-methyltransferase